MRMASYHKADEDSERDVPHRDAERGYFEVAETEKFSVALESTTQGAAMLAFAQWSDAEYASKYGQKQAIGRLINGLGLFTISFVLQALLIALLLFFSTQRMQDPYQFEETTAMAESLRKAQESNTTLPETDRVLGLCLRDHSVPYSQSRVHRRQHPHRQAAPWCEMDVDSIREDPYAPRPARLGQDRNDLSYVLFSPRNIDYESLGLVLCLHSPKRGICWIGIESFGQ